MGGQEPTMKLESKKQINGMIFLFAVTYMVSYITRINYGAMISEMVTATGFSKSLLSMAVTGSFITYGAGQIVSGVIGDKVSPKKLISIGFCITIAMNLLITVCQNPFQMLFVWCVNGFAQSFMWPPLVRLMTVLFTTEDYKSSSAKVAWGSSIGTIVVYAVSPVMILLSGWRAMFVFSAACGIVMLIFWNRYCLDLVTPKIPRDNSRKKEKAPLFSPVMIALMISIVLMGMLRDGVTTWMPSYIAETYHLSNVVSILTGVILPLFSIFCFHIGSWLYKKKFTNPVTCAGVIYILGVAAALGIVLFTGKNAVLSVAFSAVLTGSMHGVNLMLIMMLPAYFARWGHVSTASGILNSCTYIGSALSTYGVALLSEKLGWGFTVMSWLAIAVLGTVICLVCAKPWDRKFRQENP